MAGEQLTGCTIKAYKSENTCMAEMAGVLKLHNCSAVKNRVLALLQNSGQAFYLHMGQVSEVDSAGLGVLVGLHMTARKNKIDFHVMSPNSHQMKMLDATRLSSVLSIVGGVKSEEIWGRLARPENIIPIPETA